MKFNIGDIIESQDETISTVIYVKDWKIISVINKSSILLKFNLKGKEVNDPSKDIFRVISKDRPLEPDVENNNLFVRSEFFMEGNYIDVLFNDVYRITYSKDLLLYKSFKFNTINIKKSNLLSILKWANFINLFQ